MPRGRRVWEARRRRLDDRRVDSTPLYFAALNVVIRYVTLTFKYGIRESIAFTSVGLTNLTWTV